jgi:hypothetical protein
MIGTGSKAKNAVCAFYGGKFSNRSRSRVADLVLHKKLHKLLQLISQYFKGCLPSLQDILEKLKPAPSIKEWKEMDL